MYWSLLQGLQCATVKRCQVKVSCVIATCNRPKLLETQLESLFKQSRLPDEIIICEDQPSVESRNMVSKFTKSNIHMIYVENEKKLGMVKNFEGT